ncbi:MAG: lipid A deacylase LpxR family protein, partial [Bacteroidota bacterium]|nr:lipid A deacylase LpxR family protein [Bacteroidota bacterium]
LYQVYNATLQGSFFRKDKGPITDAPEPLVLTQQAGILFSGARYQVRLSANFQTREAKRQLFIHSYGSVQAAYRFR